MSEAIEILLAKADAYRTRWPVYKDMIDWLVDLLVETIQAETMVRIPHIIFDKETAAERLTRGISLFDLNILPMDLDSTRKIYGILVEKTKKHKGLRITGLKDILSGPDHEIETILRGVLRGNASILQPSCEKTGADAPAAEFILKLALKPGLTYLCRLSKGIDLSAWPYGRCPLCGADPLISGFSEGQSDRILYCTLCETAWPYPRLQCPFCENQQIADLSYLYAKEADGFQVDFCGRCERGLKTVNPQKTGHVIIPLLDDLIFTHLTMAIETYHRNMRQ